MKKIILVITAIFLTSGIWSQNLQPVKYDTAKKDTLSKGDLVMKIAIQDSIIKVKDDSIVQTKKELSIEKAKDDLWGDADPVDYLIGLLFALIGILINTTVITAKGIRKNPESPEKFHFGYWWQNNKDRIMRWIGILAVIFIGMRFSMEILQVEFTMFLAFLLGLLLDSFIEVLKNLKLKKDEQ